MEVIPVPPELEVLEALLASLRFRPGWTFELTGQSRHACTLEVVLETEDTYHPERTVIVHHRFPVPVLGSWSRADWRRWLLEQIVAVQTHEACEWFLERVDDGWEAGRWVRPFDPHRDPLQNAYRVHDWVGA